MHLELNFHRFVNDRNRPPSRELHTAYAYTIFFYIRAGNIKIYLYVIRF